MSSPKRFAITVTELSALEDVCPRTAREWARAFVEEARPMPGGYTAERRGRRTYAVYLPEGTKAAVTPNHEREES